MKSCFVAMLNIIYFNLILTEKIDYFCLSSENTAIWNNANFKSGNAI